MTQRPIKFRTYDSSLGGGFWCWTQDAPDFNLAKVLREGKQVEQFTGLLDKNGKEIYEGDVVKKVMHYGDDYGNPVGEGEEKISVVEWRENDGRQFVGFDFFPCDNIKELEVIGNIHENPGLLK